MTQSGDQLESLLAEALAPVDPSPELENRLETRLTNLFSAAAGELDGWKLGALKDPRRWYRILIAILIWILAGSALLIVRLRHQRRRRSGLRHVWRGRWVPPRRSFKRLMQSPLFAKRR